jgi:hypothetical protein
VSRTWKRDEARVFDVCEFAVYEIVVKMLLASGFFPEDFALEATNFYFPSRTSLRPTSQRPNATVQVEVSHEGRISVSVG